MKVFAKIIYLFVLATNLWLVSSEADAGSPTLIQSYQSSSGKTNIEYYGYDASPCGAGVSCDFRGVIKVPKGFEQVEVFLSGFRLEAAKQAEMDGNADQKSQYQKQADVAGKRATALADERRKKEEAAEAAASPTP